MFFWMFFWKSYDFCFFEMFSSINLYSNQVFWKQILKIKWFCVALEYFPQQISLQPSDQVHQLIWKSDYFSLLWNIPLYSCYRAMREAGRSAVKPTTIIGEENDEAPQIFKYTAFLAHEA